MHCSALGWPAKSDNIHFGLCLLFSVQSFYWAIKPHNFNLKTQREWYGVKTYRWPFLFLAHRKLRCLKLNCMHRIPGFSSILKWFFCCWVFFSSHIGSFCFVISWWFPFYSVHFDFIESWTNDVVVVVDGNESSIRFYFEASN